MFFVSTGRCGTTRVAEILKAHLPESYTVLHQTRLSRRANIIGNMTYCGLPFQGLSMRLFDRILKENLPSKNILISTDPLISMVIPDKAVQDPATAIVHITRDSYDFAQSMYQFTRKKKTSLIAHNLIPFWQPHLWPLENLINNDIINKYQFIHKQKNDFYRARYQKNPNYITITMDNIFKPPTLEHLINRLWQLNITIPPDQLTKKTNQSIQ